MKIGRETGRQKDRQKNKCKLSEALILCNIDKLELEQIKTNFTIFTLLSFRSF